MHGSVGTESRCLGRCKRLDPDRSVRRVLQSESVDSRGEEEKGWRVRTKGRADVSRVGAEGGQQGPQLQHALTVGRLQLRQGLYHTHIGGKGKRGEQR